MQNHDKYDLQNAVTGGGHEAPGVSELDVLRSVFRMLPAGVTLQDEHGDFLLINEAAAAQLGVTASDPAASASTAMNQRRETGLECLRSGRPAVAEESAARDGAKQVFLTSHRPIQIAARNLLLSSSADISEQKAVEDQLFRTAYYDELTDLPNRRVIEHRANSLLRRGRARGVRARLSRHR